MTSLRFVKPITTVIFDTAILSNFTAVYETANNRHIYYRGYKWDYRGFLLNVMGKNRSQPRFSASHRRAPSASSGDIKQNPGFLLNLFLWVLN